MFPWIYGFTWQPGNIIFLTIFFAVVCIVFANIGVAAARAFTDMKSQRLEEIRWHGDFNELSSSAKMCRHVFTGETRSRVCKHGFDCLTCEFHSQFGTLMETSGSYPKCSDKDDGHILGLDLPLTLFYHRGHTWVKKESDGTLTVGLDDFANRVVGNEYDIHLPVVGTKLVVNATGFTLKNGNSTVRILSPVEGEVIEVGGKGKGFCLKVKPSSDDGLKHLLSGVEIRPWIQSEIERLQIALNTEMTGVVLADGGELVEYLPDSHRDVDWNSVIGKVFLDP